jgi:DNA-binding protein YbaB
MTAVAEGGAVRVVADRVGRVERIEMADGWRARVGAERIGRVVLAALVSLDEARPPAETGPSAAPGADAGPVLPLLDELTRRLLEVEARLGGARVTGKAAGGGVLVEYNGMLRPVRVTVTTNGGDLAAQLTAAVRAAWTGATRLRRRAYGEALYRVESTPATVSPVAGSGS